jgi:ribose-phosphate pyrophosphokinase
MAYATHGVLSGPGHRPHRPPRRWSELTITDTIPLSPEGKGCPKIQVLSVAKLFGEAIHRIHCADSLSSLFV